MAVDIEVPEHEPGSSGSALEGRPVRVPPERDPMGVEQAQQRLDKTYALLDGYFAKDVPRELWIPYDLTAIFAKLPGVASDQEPPPDARA